MSRKLQFHTFHLLFSLLSYLADKSGGWGMFVRPKLVIGGLIVGTSIAQVASQIKKNTITRSISQQNHSLDSKKDRISSDSILYDNTSPSTFCYEDTESITIVEQMPEFPRGNEAMFKYIAEHIVYPKELYENRIKGIVICSFKVEKDSTISDIKILRGLHPLLDKEAVRIIKTFPKWNPGKQGGKAVPVIFTLPFIFKLPTK